MKRIALALLLALSLAGVQAATTTAANNPFSAGGCTAGSACTGTTITATTAFVAGVAGSASGSMTIYQAGSVNNYISLGGTVGQVLFGNQNALGTTWQIVTDTTGSGGPGSIRLGSTGSFAFNDAAGLGGGSRDLFLTRYAAARMMLSGDGTGTASGQTGWIFGNGTGTFSTISQSNDPTNYVIRAGGGSLILQADTAALASYITLFATAGKGPTITAGTTTTNANRALSISQGWTDGTTGNIGIVGNFDMGSTGTATGSLLSLQAGAGGTTEVLNINETGRITLVTNNGGYIDAPAGGTVRIASSSSAASIIVGNGQGSSGSGLYVSGPIHESYQTDLLLQGGGTYANSQSAGSVRVMGGTNWQGGTNSNGGSVKLEAGAGSGSGTSGDVILQAAIATPAGGSTSARVLFGTTAGFGVYYGSGAPSVSAAKGSIYLRSDGSGTNDRVYVNTDGGTTWTYLTSGT